jgi:hypothetical protein
MPWWNTVFNTFNKVKNSEQFNTIKEATINGATWVMDWTYDPLVTGITYIANTTVYFLKLGIATKEAAFSLKSPSLVKPNQAARTITFKLLPLIGIHTVNLAQIYLLHDERDKETWMQASMNATSTLMDWGVWIYTSRVGVELGIEVFALMGIGPSAYLEHKKRLPMSKDDPCVVNKCTPKRLFKGNLREPFILMGNDLLIFFVSLLPRIGPSGEIFLSLYFYGDYVNRSANLHCERHRTTDSELLLALGTPYVLTLMAMNAFFPSTPFVIKKTLKHLLLLGFIKIAAHMDIPYVAHGKGTLRFDPIVIYELFNSFMIDIVFEGTMSKIAQLLAPDPNKTPLVSVSWVLQTLTNMFNSDLEKMPLPVAPTEGYLPTIKEYLKKTKYILPPIFHSTKNTIHNPVLRIFWPDVQEFLLEIMKYVVKADASISTVNESNIPCIATSVKKVLPEVLLQKLNIPTKVTTVFLDLSEEKDFHQFLLSLVQWLDRHNLRVAIGLAEVDPSTTSTLFQGERVYSEPKEQVQEEVRVSSITLSKKPEIQVVTPRTYERKKTSEHINLNFFNPNKDTQAKWRPNTSASVVTSSYLG